MVSGTAISSNALSLKNFHFEFLTPSMGLTVFPNFVRSTSFPQCIIQDGSAHIYNNNIAGLDKFEQNFNQRFLFSLGSSVYFSAGGSWAQSSSKSSLFTWAEATKKLKAVPSLARDSHYPDPNQGGKLNMHMHNWIVIIELACLCDICLLLVVVNDAWMVGNERIVHLCHMWIIIM